MKKIVCMVMAVVMALGLTACGNGGNTPAGSNGGNGEVQQLTLGTHPGCGASREPGR